MSPEVATRAVEPFFTTKGQGKGSGLGLSTAYGFVQQSGGELKIRSSPGEGTEVALWLPAAKPAAAPLPGASPAPETEPDPGRILLVEDEPRVRRLARRTLEDLGYRVVEAEDARRARHILETEPQIDLLFSDIVMPGAMDGYALAHWAVHFRPRLKVLLTTGFNEAARESQRVSDEIFSLLKKPYTEEDLGAAIRAVLGDEPACAHVESSSAP
jgi:CheY-like chemotaxis protein